jgi:hypothetical protein
VVIGTVSMFSGGTGVPPVQGTVEVENRGIAGFFRSNLSCTAETAVPPASIEQSRS